MLCGALEDWEIQNERGEVKWHQRHRAPPRYGPTEAQARRRQHRGGSAGSAGAHGGHTLYLPSGGGSFPHSGSHNHALRLVPTTPCASLRRTRFRGLHGAEWADGGEERGREQKIKCHPLRCTETRLPFGKKATARGARRRISASPSYLAKLIVRSALFGFAGGLVETSRRKKVRDGCSDRRSCGRRDLRGGHEQGERDGRGSGLRETESGGRIRGFRKFFSPAHGEGVGKEYKEDERERASERKDEGETGRHTAERD